MACCNAVAHFPNYNSIAILRQRVDRRAIRKTDAHEQRWRQPPNIHSLAEFGGEQKFSSAWTARCSDHPHGGPFVNGKGCTWPKAVGFDSIRHSNSRRRNRYWPNRHRISFIGSIRHHPCDRLGDRQVYLRLSAYGPKQTYAVAPHMSAFGGKADIIQEKADTKKCPSLKKKRLRQIRAQPRRGP